MVESERKNSLQKEHRSGCPWFLNPDLPTEEFKRNFNELFRDREREEDDY